jgi:hypothetical protein
MRHLIIALVAVAPGAAAAGAFHANPGAAPEYRFVGCATPAEPDMTIDAKLKGKDYVAAHNARVKAYNLYVEGLNAYVKCLGDEARRDLETYYATVNGRLEGEQAAIFARADELRAGLAPKPPPAAPK